MLPEVAGPLLTIETYDVIRLRSALSELLLAAGELVLEFDVKAVAVLDVLEWKGHVGEAVELSGVTLVTTPVRLKPTQKINKTFTFKL